MRVPISSVVLSSQRVDTRDALYNATRGKKQAEDDAKNPLVQEGLKLIPSVTRVFHTSREMYVYSAGLCGRYRPQRICRRSRTPRHLYCVCESLRAREEGFESPPLAVTPAAGSRLGAVPLSFHIRLGGWRRGVPVPDHGARSGRTSRCVLGESDHAGEVNRC